MASFHLTAATKTSSPFNFLKEGGLRERMTRARVAQRAKQSYNPPDP
jgi:hypothetical protein